MTKTLDFIFDFGSPNAYYSWKVLAGVLERTGEGERRAGADAAVDELCQGEERAAKADLFDDLCGKHFKFSIGKTSVSIPLVCRLIVHVYGICGFRCSGTIVKGHRWNRNAAAWFGFKQSAPGPENVHLATGKRGQHCLPSGHAGGIYIERSFHHLVGGGTAWSTGSRQSAVE